MRPLVSILIGYLVLVTTALLTLAATIGFLGTETLLVPGAWRFSLWFAVVGPFMLVVPAILSGYTAAKVAGQFRSALILAVFVTVFGLVAGSTSIRKSEDYDDRRWTPKFTEMIRRVREPLPAMVAGSFVMGGGVAVGGALAVVGFGGVRAKSAGPRVIHGDPRSVRRR